MGGSPMREERKVVTALFADVVDSTRLTEELDPEDAREVLGGAVTRMVEAVEAFGGTVKDLAGDGVLALFGAPRTHEDDPERAIRAGLRIVGDEGGPSVRVGIETGLVVLGPVGGGGRVEYGATGDAINVAARLQAHASPGAVLVGEVTRRAVGHRFDWGDELRLELKGKTEPVSAFPVAGEAPHRPAPAPTAPMVGREAEFERASRLADRGLAGEGGLIVVVGEPGIGKSRLVDELRTHVGDATWLEGHCVSFGEGTPYLPLREVVSDALELSRGEPVQAAVVHDRARAIDEGLDDVAPFLAGILGLPDETRTRSLSPETLRLRTLDGLRRLVLTRASNAPAAIAIEDLHWADASTLQALERLLPASRGVPLLFVLTSRPDGSVLDELRRGADGLDTEIIELAPLPSDRQDELVQSLLEGEEIPAELRRRVVDTAGGNPFFVSELVRSLVGSGVLAREGDGADRGSAVELPTTIEKVILSRLDALEPSARDVLTAASVLGRMVALPVLERVIGADPSAETDELVDVRLFERDGRPDELAFAHVLIQEVAYGSLLKRRRRELHAAAAAAIEELWPEQIDEHLDELARHHRGAGDLEAARRCHDLAADRAERLHAADEALEHLTASIDLSRELGLSVDDRELAERLLARGRVLARTGDATGARADLETIVAGVGAGIPADVVMSAHDELGFALAGAADYRAAIPHLEAALEAATTLHDAAGEVSALSRLAIVQSNRLDFEAAIASGERALASATSLRDEHAEATAMDALKQVALQTGDVERLEALAGRLIEIHRRNDDLWYLQFAILEIGYAALERMYLDRAIAALDEGLAICRRIGDLGNEPLYVVLQGRTHRGRGDYDAALEVIRQAFDLAGEVGHAEWTAWTATWLGSTLLEVGALTEAATVLSLGIEAADRAGADLHLLRCLGLSAWAADRLGDPDRAAELADQAAPILDRILPPRLVWVAGQDAYVSVARVWLARGEADRAAALVAPMVEACTRSGWCDGIVEGSLVLAEVALHAGDAARAVDAAGSAVAEAERTRLPTAWRAHRVFAEAYRVAGEDAGAAEHDAVAERAVASLAARIHDRTIRDAFLSAATGGPASGGVER